MKLKPLTALKNINGRRVLVRCDFDVPLGRKTMRKKNTSAKQRGKFEIKDDTRLEACLPTIQYLLKNKARVILIGHLGRPKGQVVPELSLLPAKDYLAKMLKHPVTLIPLERYIGEAPARAAKQMKAGDLIMLENVRFSDREELNCHRFAKALAALADVYINEAFSVSHRPASSVSAVREYLPSYAGFHLQEEIDKLSLALKKPTHPLTLIIGGAKIETKLPVIKQFIGSAEHILVGGAVANDFFKALGYEVGTSLIDEEYIQDASSILEKISQVKTELILPVDVEVSNGKKSIIREPFAVHPKEMILDIGPKTIKLYQSIIKKSKMIIWNGPLGKFEEAKFSQGTKRIAAALQSSQAKVLVGGGETGELFKTKGKTKLRRNIFASVGGGAMLEFLASKKLPGLN